MTAPANYSQQRLHFQCPSCQQALVCFVGGLAYPPEPGWPDAPSHSSFYEAKLDPAESKGALTLKTLWGLSEEVECPACQHAFTLDEAGVAEPEKAIPELQIQGFWKESYRALGTGRFRKSDEFKIRMDLWRRSNEPRRSAGGLLQSLLSVVMLAPELIKRLLAPWHFKAVTVLAIFGLLVGCLRSAPWSDVGLYALSFAALPSFFILGVAALFLPVLLSLLFALELRGLYCSKQWRTKGSPYRENLRALLVFLNEDDPFERLVKAEGHRQLGQFNEALALIEQGFPEELSRYGAKLQSLCQEKNAQFIYSEAFIDRPEESESL